jgi:hypothetical protein
MDTLKQVKAEVKAWERAFKAENKREPTKNDIKTAPGIGAWCREPREQGMQTDTVV